MNRRRISKGLVAAVASSTLYLADAPPDAPLGLTAGRDAHAIVGAPLTPVSVAGVARRTTRRVVVADAAVVSQQQAAVAQQQAAAAQQQAAVAQQQATAAQQQTASARPPAGAPAVGAIVGVLPGGCVPEVKAGVEYQRCAGVYYRPAFQGNNLVYVVQAP